MLIIISSQHCSTGAPPSDRHLTDYSINCCYHYDSDDYPSTPASGGRSIKMRYQKNAATDKAQFLILSLYIYWNQKTEKL
jgi:hypothetical protein